MKAVRVVFLATCLSVGLELGLANPARNQMDEEPVEYCTTFDQKPGKIVQFYNCGYIMDIIAKHQAKQQLTDRELDITKYSRRVSFGPQAVCCEDFVDESGLELLKESESNCGEFVVELVVGGHGIRMGSRPWMALLKYNNTFASERSFKCGATLITPRYLLTAAHCVTPSLISVRLGEHNISTETDCKARGNEVLCLPPHQDVPVEKAIAHKSYNVDKLTYDIGLIRLRRPATITNYVKTICLPLYQDVQRSIRRRSVQQVTGWGFNDYGVLSDVPNEAPVTRLLLSRCHFNRSVVLLENQMCFSAFRTDSCGGDSGGPLSFPYLYQGPQRFVQMGIVSYGPRKCGSGGTAVYTDVISFLPWITQNIEA